MVGLNSYASVSQIKGDGRPVQSEAARAAVKGLKAKERSNDETVREAVRIAVRRSFRKSLDKNPVITVHQFRV